MKDFIEHRIDLNYSIVPVSLYAEGILDIVGFLYDELKKFLIKEGRFFGIVKSYTNSIDKAISKINSQVQEEDIETYGRILYLFRPLIKREFTRLQKKHLTEGDSVIVIINKIITILKSIAPDEDFRFSKEVKTIGKVIEKMFDNIKNKQKKDPLFFMSNTIRVLAESGLVGKYEMDSFSLTDPDIPKEKLVGLEKTVVEQNGLKVIGEIDFIDPEK